jgi:hypothetical protein
MLKRYRFFGTHKEGHVLQMMPFTNICKMTAALVGMLIISSAYCTLGRYTLGVQENEVARAVDASDLGGQRRTLKEPISLTIIALLAAVGTHSEVKASPPCVHHCNRLVMQGICHIIITLYSGRVLG